MPTHPLIAACVAVTILQVPLGGQALEQAAVSRMVDANGARFHVRTMGSGPPLLLLHGFLASGQNWDPFLPELATQSTVVVLDLRGHGRSTNPSGLFSHQQAALDAFAVMDALGFDRFSAVGHSSGGHTLLHMATQQPARVQNMILLAAVPYFTSDVRKAIDGAPAFDRLSPEDQLRLARFHAGGIDQARVLYAQWKRFPESFGDVNFNPAQLASIAARTLVVFGDRDDGNPVELAVQMYRSIPNSALWIVPSTGHMLHLAQVGGSPSAANILPRVVTEFIAGKVWTTWK